MEICFSAACLTHLGKKHFAASFDEVPADLVEHRHMVNSISGAPTRSQIQSPGLQRERYNNENRGRNRTQGKEQGRRDSSQGKRNSRNSSSTRLCYNWDKKKTYFAATCLKPKKEEGKVEGRSITPYPRSGDSSRDGCGGSQGGDTYIKVHSAM